MIKYKEFIKYKNKFDLYAAVKYLRVNYHIYLYLLV